MEAVVVPGNGISYRPISSQLSGIQPPQNPLRAKAHVSHTIGASSRIHICNLCMG